MTRKRRGINQEEREGWGGGKGPSNCAKGSDSNGGELGDVAIGNQVGNLTLYNFFIYFHLESNVSPLAHSAAISPGVSLQPQSLCKLTYKCLLSALFGKYFILIFPLSY